MGCCKITKARTSPHTPGAARIEFLGPTGTGRLLGGRPVSCPLPAVDGNEVAFGRADEELAWPGDLLLLVQEHLLPLRNPPCRPRNREEDRKHRDRKAHRLVDDARIEVHVGIELPFDEVLVFQRDTFELECDVEKGFRPVTSNTW